METEILATEALLKMHAEGCPETAPWQLRPCPSHAQRLLGQTNGEPLEGESRAKRTCHWQAQSWRGRCQGAPLQRRPKLRWVGEAGGPAPNLALVRGTGETPWGRLQLPHQVPWIRAC